MNKTKGEKPVKSFYPEEASGPPAPWPCWEELEMNSFLQNREGGLQSGISQDIVENLETKCDGGGCGGSGLENASLSSYSSNWGYSCLDPIS